MAIYKCKMCGGTLEVVEENSVVECEFCGTKQTIPTSKDENLQGLFNRANILRMKGEFDKAEQLYEKIIENDETQAEAYWGLILCKYGIEYVEDPAIFKRMPTCHRTSFDSIVADEDYKAAITNADIVQRGIYEAEAKEIDRIQKGILELAQKEEAYDVFICYKEVDSTGKRTQDSVIANDIYHQLTQEGLKVFYAAITLENKLGSAYEPCIFAALNSAKVMLAIGTKPEYFNAVWVKNEWSRFLKILQKDRSKILIPCYRDMDAYELPEEFAHLQAQDMSKIGFINDVVRGIKKVVIPEVKVATVQQTQVIENANGNVQALLDRGFMALEDGEWKKADEFFEQALNFEAKIAEAYLGKLMSELCVKTREELKNCAQTFEGNNNYQKVIRFGDEKLKNELNGYLSFIKERNAQEELERIYLEAKGKMNAGDSKSYQKAIELFEQIINYKDSKLLKEQCAEMIEKILPIEMQKQRENAQAFNKMQIINSQTSISKGADHIVVLKNDGTVVANGSNSFNQCEVLGWRDIVSVSAGKYHTVGLRRDGTVVAIGDNGYNQCEVLGWRDIVSISAGEYHTVGLRRDGTVVAIGSNGDNQCKVSEWRDVVSISASEKCTRGIKNDGAVVGTDKNFSTECELSEWSDIVAISEGSYHTAGLRSDGTVIETNYYKASNKYGVSNWRDVVSICAGDGYTVGLKSDGTIVVSGYDSCDQYELSEWSDIVSVFRERCRWSLSKRFKEESFKEESEELVGIAVPIHAETREELMSLIEKRFCSEQQCKEAAYVEKKTAFLEKQKNYRLQRSA